MPRPERVTIHKVIVADRRRDGTDYLKSRKVRAQTGSLIKKAGPRPVGAPGRSPRCSDGHGPVSRARIAASLSQVLETKTILEA